MRNCQSTPLCLAWVLSDQIPRRAFELLDDFLTTATLFVRQPDDRLLVHGTPPGAPKFPRDAQNHQPQFLALRTHYPPTQGTPRTGFPAGRRPPGGWSSSGSARLRRFDSCMAPSGLTGILGTDRIAGPNRPGEGSAARSRLTPGTLGRGNRACPCFPTGTTPRAN